MPTNATVIARQMRRPDPGAAYAASVVTLLINDPALGIFTVETPHPAATLTEIWQGGTVAITVSAGTPPVIAYAPTIAQARQRATLIALAVALALAMVSGMLTLREKRR